VVSKAMQRQVCKGKSTLADKTGLVCDKLKPKKFVNTTLPLSVSSHLKPFILYSLPNPPTRFHRTIQTMCVSRKYPYSPHRRDWNFLGGEGFYETKKFKEMYDA